MVRLCFVCLVFALMIACGGGGGGGGGDDNAPGSPAPAPTVPKLPDNPATGGPDHWWNRAVFYEVFVRSYADSENGALAHDGIGDFQGLIERLDYLNDGDPATQTDLGVTALWLMPIMQSPSYHGYDVTDYYQIEREYGTNEDFLRFMTEARARGIKVVIDLVLNHSSSQHPFFLDSRRETSAYRDWFVWSPNNPGYSGPWDQPVWHRGGSDYYFGLFWSGMPDWNFRNEAVTAEMHEATRFWLEEMDVDGFRLDAIRYLYENGEDMDDVEETHVWLQNYVAYYKSIRAEAVTVGEVWADAATVASYAGEMDLNFQFDLAGAILEAVRTGNGIPLEANLQTSWDAFAENQFATFLTNHDQDRVMSVLQGDENRARLAASLLLTIPGVPFLYYGEEIGMRGVKPDPLIRTPLQWSPQTNAGFSNVAPWQAPNEDYASVNIATQQSDPGSLWSHYRNLISLRGENEALRLGNFSLVDTSSASILAFLRQSPGESIFVLANLGNTDISEYTLNLDAPYQGALELLHGATLVDSGVTTVNGISGFSPISTLEAHALYVIHF